MQLPRRLGAYMRESVWLGSESCLCGTTRKFVLGTGQAHADKIVPTSCCQHVLVLIVRCCSRLAPCSCLETYQHVVFDGLSHQGSPA